MNTTASSERLHIGFFGRSNVGKSSLMNAVTGQDMSVVSDTRGTTTDPVLKSMELLPLGPVVMFDTPGLDDDTELGALRMRKARELLYNTSMRSSEIAYAVGYNDPHYFSYLFKKNTGVTPSEFRSGVGQGDDGGEEEGR